MLLSSAATLCATAAFGFTEIGRGELLLSTSARETYDSRVFGGVSGSDDYIFTLAPQLQYLHESCDLKLNGLAGVRVNRYANFSDLDSEDAEANVKLTLPPDTAALASGTFESSYNERTDVNYDVNRRIREKIFDARLDSLIPISLKTSLLLGGMYRHEVRNEFSDRNTREGTAGFRYMNFLGGSGFDLTYTRLDVDSSGGNFYLIPLSQQSDMVTATFSRPLYDEVRGSISYGYRWLRRSRAEVFGADPNTAGSVLALNLDGPFLPPRLFPKLESSLSIGYQKSETPGINDLGGSRLIGTLHLAWHARERTEVLVDASRGRQLSVNDLTVLTTTGMLGIREHIGDFMTGTISGGYEQRDYVSLGRKDNVALGAASLNYRITKYWSADAEYRLRAANSTVTTADYSRHVVMVSATYTF